MSQHQSWNHQHTAAQEMQYDLSNDPEENPCNPTETFPAAETILKSWNLDRKLPSYFFAVAAWFLNTLVAVGNFISAIIYSLYSLILHVGERSALEDPDPPQCLIYTLTWLTRLMFPVQAFGTRRIPKAGKILFVGNGQTYGLDSIFIVQEIYRTTGIYPRVMADRIYHKIPILKQILEYFGCFRGTPQNFLALMSAGKPILIFPSRKEVKHAGNTKYNLEWNDRLGFARMAIEHEYQVVPLAMIGLEDTFEPWFDFPVTPLLRLFGDMRKDFVLPMPKLWKIQPQKNYLEFGHAIPSSSFGHDTTNILQATSLREEVLVSVRKMLQELLLWQSRDPKRYPYGMFKNYVRECIIRHLDMLGLNGKQLAEALGFWKANPEIVVMIGE